MRQEESSKKPTPEEREYQKRISDLLGRILETSEGVDPTVSLELLYNQISEDPKLLEFMNSDRMGWAMVAYTLDRKDMPRRINKLIDSIGVKVDPESISREIKNIESLQVKMVIQDEIEKAMMMSKLKQALGGELGEGVQILRPGDKMTLES